MDSRKSFSISTRRFFESIQIDGKTIAPALFLAPMAGITNSAFRRLLSDFGGYGALTTEMLSVPAFLHENPAQSAFSKRRDCEGSVIYQLQTSGEQNLEAAIIKLEKQNPTAIDLNLGCPAPEIQKLASGAALFRDFERLKQVLTRIRDCYQGTLTVKCRLGDDPENWREPFLERLKLFEDFDVHAITVHPRFSTEKLKRRARWQEFPWIASQTRLPIIGNGDIETFRRTKPLSALLRVLCWVALSPRNHGSSVNSQGCLRWKSAIRKFGTVCIATHWRICRPSGQSAASRNSPLTFPKISFSATNSTNKA
jgi:tRNA-dihydrouridine synthase